MPKAMYTQWMALLARQKERAIDNEVRPSTRMPLRGNRKRGYLMAAYEGRSVDGIPTKSAIAVAVSVALTGHGGEAQAQDRDSKESRGIEEITVTARKREESLQDIPASIQALTGADMKRQGLNNLEDIVRFLPNVSAVGTTAGENKVIFRGVSDNPGAFIAASSAAVYLDEQPLTQFAVNPEPRMVDMERVEALAGPQGTLYGDSSQSGTLRFITNKPNPTEFEANVDVMTRFGSDSAASYDVSGMVNIPLMQDKFALRLVGFSATDGGFIDNVLGVSPQLGTVDNADVVEEDFNDVDVQGGRISAKWFVNDEWSVTGAYLYQKTESAGRNTYDPTVGDLQTVKFFKDKRDDKWQQLSLTVEGRIGSFDIVSNTGYFERDTFYVDERTTYAAYFNYNFCVYAQFAGYCWSGQTFYDQDTVGFSTNDQENTRFTQEFRLTQSGDNYRFIAGVFYEEKTEDWDFLSLTPDFENTLGFYYFTGILGYTASGGAPAWWRSADSTDWKQWAVFTNLNYDFSDSFSAEVGLRYFDQEMDRRYLVDKAFISAPGVWPDVVSPTGGNQDIVPKVTLTYKFDDEKLLYALYSEGWRAGGANRNRTPFTFFPVSYDPDLLKNFEVGVKTRWLDNRLQVNATAYFGQWENYQIEAVDPSFKPCEAGQDPIVDLCDQPFQVMVANVGDAEQQGLELEVRAAPSEGFDLGMSLGYVDAKTTNAFIVSDLDVLVPKGSRLPNVPEWKANGYVQYTWPFNATMDMYVRGQVSWQDESRNQLEDFTPEPLVQARGTYIQPSYSIADLKVGVANDTWTLEAFVNNLSDERAVLYEDDQFFDAFWGGRRVTTNRPREFGVRFSYNWD